MSSETSEAAAELIQDAIFGRPDELFFASLALSFASVLMGGTVDDDERKEKERGRKREKACGPRIRRESIEYFGSADLNADVTCRRLLTRPFGPAFAATSFLLPTPTWFVVRQ